MKPTEQHLPRRILGKTTLQEHAVAVTTQEVLDVEENTLNWVSISSSGALDMPLCDFSVRSARDELRHAVGSSEPDVIIVADKDQIKGCKNKTKTTRNSSANCAKGKRRAVATSCMSGR